MWKYEKKLQYPVNIKNVSPKNAQIIISQFGGPDGELGASMRYLTQRYSQPFNEVKGMLTDIMNNPNAPINDLLNRNYILDILNTDGNAFTRPWFGQLMTGPQLMAYLCQVNMWLEKYHPEIEI